MRKLLAVDKNAKTIKGQKYGFMTGVLYLAPYTISGQNVCPMAEIAGCHKACLYTAGRGAMSNVQQARINKTILFNTQYEYFMNVLAIDIARLIAKANKEGLTPLVRLNGTSDIIWERKSFIITQETSEYIKRYYKMNIASGEYNNMMEAFKGIQFYDYTKLARRFQFNLPNNYDLTFSYSGVEGYEKQVELAVKFGARIAVVFRDKNLPTHFLGMNVVNGDASDLRHLDAPGVIVGLYAKGKAKKDQSGFVVDIA